MAQQSLYFQTKLEDKVSLLPSQMVGNMENYLLQNLEAKVKDKVTEHGIVLKVNRIIEYDYGIISKNNFSGTAIYRVKYECLICSPVKNLSIVCLVENIVKGYIIAKNGPVIVAIPFNNIDSDKFQLTNGNIVYKNNSNNIQKGDYVKVSIINIKTNLNEKKITTIAKLLDMATNDEIKSYENDQLLIVNGDIDDGQEFI